MKIGVIILARANFGRWPDKVLFKLQGKTLLEHVIRKSLTLDVDTVIVSTTESEEDQIIRDIAWDAGANISRGEPEDRTARYCRAIEDYNLDYFIAIAPGYTFFDVEYQNRLINSVREKPGYGYYNIGLYTSFVPCIFNSAIPLEGIKQKNRDQELFYEGMGNLGRYNLYSVKDPELKNRYLSSGNIAYRIQADNYRRICEYLGHFPESYDEVVEALMGIEL